MNKAELSKNGHESEEDGEQYLVEESLNRIRDVEEYVSENVGSTGRQLVADTDDALVFCASSIIKEADIKAERTLDEQNQVSEAVRDVLIRGAMEEAGEISSAERNPILSLEDSGASADIVDGIRDLHEKKVILTKGLEVAELAARAIDRDEAKRSLDVESWGFRKVGDAINGSNDGGWYENELGERYYVKKYKNPNQARSEYIANKIYCKLGILAPESQIIGTEDDIVIASKEIGGGDVERDISVLQNSADIRNGFVADAFLANWDVIGASYDNINSVDGHQYRIDNGGSLSFRATGGEKPFSPDNIPELQSMRDIDAVGRTAPVVFCNLTDEDISHQAKTLVEALKPTDIREIIESSGMTGEDQDLLVDALLGRRRFLKEQFVDEIETDYVSKSPAETVDELMKRGEEARKLGAYPSAEIICGGSRIEGQRIEAVYKPDKQVIEYSFKMLGGIDDLTIGALTRYFDKQSEVRHQIYESASGDEAMKSNFAAKIFESGPTSIALAANYDDGDNQEKNRDEDTDRYGRQQGAFTGMVQISVPSDILTSEQSIMTLKNILHVGMNMKDAMSEISEEDQAAFREARYRWQYLTNDELTAEQAAEMQALRRTEVFQGYSTLVNKNKYKEYLEKYGSSLRAYHEINNPDADVLYNILTNGLMSTTERLRRGVRGGGKSSDIDQATGGADSVFTRVGLSEEWQGCSGVNIVFKPQLFDRTDWYSYLGDHFGSTLDTTFKDRVSPDQLFSECAYSGIDTEQMFRTGIGPNYIEKIVVSDSYDGKTAKERCEQFVDELKAKGLEVFDGDPIEELFMPASNRANEKMNDYSLPNDDLITDIDFSLPEF